MWLNLVEHLVWDQEVAGSSPVFPTILEINRCYAVFIFYKIDIMEGKNMLTIMTFNIKNKIIFDNFNKYFKLRTQKIIDIIKTANPDVIGLQEVTFKMKKVLEKNFSEYNFFGRSRYNNDEKFDEYNLIMINKKYNVLSSETYSLGSDINKISSKDFLNVFPRVCSYVEFEYKNRNIVFLNTQLDSILNYSRAKQLKRINNIIEQHNFDNTIIVGDFNLSKDSELLKKFMGVNYNNVSDELEYPTYKNKFIDHILLTEKFSLLNILPIDVNKMEKYPSSHFPIIAKINIK